MILTTLKQVQEKYPTAQFVGEYFYIDDTATIEEGAIICEGVDIRKGATVKSLAIIDSHSVVRKYDTVPEGAFVHGCYGQKYKNYKAYKEELQAIRALPY